ncbi:MAG: histidinol-phosphate transaminase [Candidatus Omnitrophica bacterium]|nr:histidinol-phosphate transaminase [Candidatus Omnitrophota bacterium]
MLARKDILKIKPYLPGRPIDEVKRSLKLKRVIKLASNENALGPSPKAIQAIKRALSGVNRYPDGDCFYLKQKLARKLRLSPKNLIFGCGSDELIVLAVRAFVNKNDEVVIARPTFLIYELVSRIAGAKIKFVPLKDLRYDLVGMKKAISSRTKIVFIANPDNPTGTYVSKNELDSFLRGLPKDLIVFIDEAYYELVAKRDFPNSLRYINKGNVIVARTFSKAYGLSGLRIGYGLSSPRLIDYMNRVREPFNVNSLAQVAALAALDDSRHLARTRRLLSRGKAYLYKNLRELNLSYIESVTNFVLIDAGKGAERIYQQLMKKGVIVRHMRVWGMNNFIRVTVGTMPENRRFIAALKQTMPGGKR